MAARENRSAINLEPDKHTTNRVETLCLIGKLIVNKSISKDLVKSITTSDWKCKNRFSISGIDRNMYIFMFQDKDDLGKVLLDAPWFINGGLLTLSPFCSGKLPSELNLSYSPFWVQVHGLPLDYQTAKNGLLIGETLLGKYICVDTSTLNVGFSSDIVWRSFIRIRVVIDVGNPLRTGFWLKREGLPNIWIVFKYEKLGCFCYGCGRIGHEHRVCKFPARNINFGPWLRAAAVGSTQFDFSVLGAAPRPRAVNRGRGFRPSSTGVVSVNPLSTPTNQSLMLLQLCSELEMEVPGEHHDHPLDESRRYIVGKFLINGVDTIAMVMNSMVICLQVKYANVLEANWTLFLMMAGYLLYLVFKLSHEIRQSWYFKAYNIRVPLAELSIRALVEVFIFLVSFLVFLSP